MGCVGLNAHLLSLSATYRGAGISRYQLHLLIQLRRQRAHEYVVLLGKQTRHPDLAEAPGWTVRRSRWPTSRPVVRMLWEQLVQPLEVARARLDAHHSLAFVAPLRCPVPSLVTIYDLSFLTISGSHPALNRFYLSTFTRLSARLAAGVFAISEHTRADVVRLLGVPAERVAIAYPGLEPGFRPPDLSRDELASWRADRGLPQRYVLFLGTLEPRKNVARLIEAYAEVRRQLADAPPLVVAGGKGWAYESIFAQVERLGLREWVLFPGFVPAAEQALWYGAAELFVYPSLYEGFGFPPLEAMACGTPVITSNVSSLPEVVGDAGIQVDPRSTRALADAMRRLLADAEQRAELRRRGLEQARRFDWAETARRTTQVYEQIVTRSELPSKLR